ncbi:MAG: ABC transporter ATP-binding protein [Clostridiaceae bacterium]|jgi:simple sugar transport system ATP-binding protein|nr:ABC transporter ATP-binding protein [Bacillota bacterium]NLN51246.1 ABC transporter ATP-binding protein [Clostridiaceae bacterium]
MTEEYDYIIEFKNITKKFPGVIANNDVSLSIRQGEIFALLGENGAGKSTLMSILFGMYEPDQGEIWLRGEKVKINSPNQATELSIGMVHQHFKLVENFTITENIVLGIEPQKSVLGLPIVDIKGTDQKIKDLSHKYGLDVNPTDLIEDINVSTRQRVEILKMLYREAEILIFDEPTAMLTPQEIEFLLEIIKNLQADGKTIILISHKLDEIKQVADRCAVLRHGELIDILDVKTTSTQTMANLMVGKQISLSLDKEKNDPGKTVLEVDNLVIENELGIEIVHDVSFVIRTGEIFSLAGVSGNGQMEIADAIAGLIPVKSGKIKFEQTEITDFSVRDRTELGISYIPEDRQRFGLILEMPLSTNLALKSYYKEPFSRNHILQDRVFLDYSDQLINKFDIRSGQGSATIVRSMSGGNQQKAIIAREIDLDSKLLIFVQPTRGLDIGAIQAVRERMIAERDKGKAILLVSLELDEIMSCSDRIGVIYNGKLQRVSDADLISREEIGEAMMGVANNEQ